MDDIFYDKLSGELQVPASEETIQQAVVACTNDDETLIQIMKQRCQNEHGVTNNEQTGVQQRVEQISEKEMDTYFAYIAGIDFVDLIRQFPSTKYDEKAFNRDLVLVVKEPIYTACMFDVFGWWRVVRRNKFKYLEVYVL
jgi:hypothetical protein